MASTNPAPDPADAAARNTMTDHEANKLVQNFFDARPDIKKAFTSFVREIHLEFQASTRRHDRLVLRTKHARDLYDVFLKLVANTELDLSDMSNVSPSTVAAAKAIVDVQYKIPMDLPPPLIWPVDQTYQSSPAGISKTASSDFVADSDDGASSGDSGSNESLLDDLVSRLAVSMNPSFTYPPELFQMSSPSSQVTAGAAPSFSARPSSPGFAYGHLYRVEYPTSIAQGNTSERLKQMGLKLPQVVLDLGRVVTTSEMEERSDGSTWSPSDFAVMVDMESTARTVWLLCDSHVIGHLRLFNDTDGVPGDLEMVWSLFDSKAMDLALLFPRIEDWTNAGNTWAALHDRISKTAMKLGLRLRHL